MNNFHSLCVFCGASTPAREDLAKAIRHLGDEMVQHEMGLVYGGGRVGLMGMVAEQVLSQGGRVIGVIPHQLQRRELAFHGLSELYVVDSMHERKALMYEKSDAFVAFPGGFGTMDEIMEILTWKQLGIHDKPIIFANIDGYYDHLKAFFDRAVDDGLIKADYVPLYHFADSVEGIFSYLEGYTPHRTGIMRWA